MPRPERTEATPSETQKVGALRPGLNQLHMQDVGGRGERRIVCDRRREQCAGGDSEALLDVCGTEPEVASPVWQRPTAPVPQRLRYNDFNTQLQQPTAEC